MLSVGCLKSMLPTAGVVYLTFAAVARDWEKFPALLHGNGRGLLAFAGERMFALAWKSSLVLLAWSAADYLLERWRHENELKDESSGFAG